MVKHILLLIGLSVAAIYFQDQLMRGLQFFMLVHTELAKGLGDIFSVDRVGEVVQSVLALLLIPAVIGVILAVSHFFIRKHHFTHTMTTIWVAWAVLLVSVLSQAGHVVNHVACSAQPKTAQAGAVKVPGSPAVPTAATPDSKPTATPATTPAGAQDAVTSGQPDEHNPAPIPQQG